MNLGEGTTINSLLKYFDTASLEEKYTSGLLSTRLRELRRSGLRRILLDEVSMLDAQQLTILVRAIDECNEDSPTTREPEIDQLGLTLVGDFCQLPPVKAPFAFESPEWDRFTANTLKLDTIHRQDDREFKLALQAIRRGDGAAAVDALRECFCEHTSPTFDGSTLVAKNETVDRYNGLRMDTLRTSPEFHTSSRWGEQRSEWKQIPEQLPLKPGCLVMVLANSWDEDDARYRYVNGDLGTYHGAEGVSARVTIKRTGREELVVPVTRECLEPLEVGEKKALKAAGEADRIREKQKVTGAITYMPLRVAYATTIHKSQGLTLDRVQVSLREAFMSSPGMVYVALSRARTRAGLRIIGSPQTFVARCRVDPKLRRWL